MSPIIDAMLESIDWNQYRSLLGPSEFVPQAIRRLLSAATKEEAKLAYWELDNRIIVQGQIFEVAVMVIPLLMVGILSDLTQPAKLRVMDLLVELASGDSDASEEAIGNHCLGDQCRHLIARGLWILLALLFDSDPEIRCRTLQILAHMDIAHQHLESLLHHIAQEDETEAVRILARKLLQAKSTAN